MSVVVNQTFLFFFQDAGLFGLNVKWWSSLSGIVLITSVSSQHHSWLHSSKSVSLIPCQICFLVRLVVFILLKPQFEFKKSHILKNIIAVLVDDTKSMSIKTFPSELSRKDFVRKAFKKNWSELESFKNNFHIDYYFVSNQCIQSCAPQKY